MAVFFNWSGFAFALLVGIVLAVVRQRTKCMSVSALFGCYLLVHHAAFLHWRAPCWWLQKLLPRCSRQCLIRREPTLFIDRLCVHQTDPFKQLTAIEGLAGILAQSDSVLALWSRSFMGRLWCSFELSVFLAAAQDPSKLKLIPNSFGVIFLCSNLLISNVHLVTLASVSCAGDDWSGVFATKSIALVCYFFTACFVRHCAGDLMTQQQHARTFCIHQTKCAVELDRAILYNTMQLLFGSRFSDGQGGFLS